jgi:hypothetical protein
VLTRWFDLYQSNYDNLSDDPNPDFRTFETLEMLITKTHAAGGMVHIWAWGDESRHMTPDKWGKNKQVDQRLQRYIAARLGPIPGWTMGYGFDCDEWVVKEDLQQWHAYMHKHFGWPHLLGARDPNPNYPSDPLSQIYEALDYSGYEHHRPTYQDYVRAIEGRPDKPSFSEDRFRIRVPARYPKKDYNEELTRRGLWDSTMAGGVANIWGNLDGATSDASVAYPHKEWIKTYAVFFKHRFLNGMVRDNDLTDGVCLKLPQHTHFVFYKENTDSITFDLSDIPTKLPCIAVDACKPYEEIKIGLRAAGKTTWKAPYVSDWAVAVGAFGSK